MARKKIFSVTIKDCEVETFRTGGKGGQGRDKTSNGVRITHKPSKAVGKATDSRKQIENKRLAFKRMAETPQFQHWCKVSALGLPSIDEIVNEWMKEENLIIE